MANKSQKKLVFISHIESEKEIAFAFKKLIERAFLGMIDVFVSSDPDSIAMGGRWLDDITENLSRCHVEIVFASPTSIARPWINFEAGAGWVREIPVIPICHSGMTPSKLLPPLSNLQGATATKPEELQNVFLRLARTLEGHAPEGDFSEFVRTVEAFQETSDKLVAAENRALTSEVSGLRDYELATLSAMADIVDAPYSQISASEIRARMSESFYAPRATVLGLAGLSRRALVAEVDRNRDERYDRDIALYFITATGWQFLIDNADKLELKVQPSPSSGRRTPATPPPGDDIPF